MLLHENIIGKRFKHALISDPHFGTQQASHDAFNEAVEMIGTNNWYWSFGGDVIEAKYVGHPHFNAALHEGKNALVEAQCKYAIKKVRPIKNRCVSWNIGNHEDNKGIIPIMNPGRYMTEKLGIRVPVAWTVKMKLAEDYIFFYTHGRLRVNSGVGSPAQIELNEAERIKRKLWRLPGVSDANIVAVAHIHKLRIADPVEELDIWGIDGLHQEINSEYKAGHSLSRDSKWYCSTGSFMKTTEAQVYDPNEKILDEDGDVESYGTEDVLTYSEKFMYAKTEMGFIVITVDGGRPVNVEKITL